MDTAAVIDRLRKFIDLIEHKGRVEDLGTRYDEIRAELVVIRKIAAVVAPNELNSLHQDRGLSSGWESARRAANRLLAELERSPDMAKLLGPTGPTLRAASLHPWVWEAAARLWDDAHYRAALQTAGLAVETQLQAKLGVYAESGSMLVGNAFSTRPASPSSPRLRLTQYEPGSDNWVSTHDGAAQFGRGCMMAIRNLATHDPSEPDPHVALEKLAALSVLARWIEAGEVVRA